jgi:predicted transcriptional regulator of viral defense system
MSDTRHADRSALNRLAYDQSGYFTAQQAAERGFSPQLLAHHLKAGHLEHPRRGLYRLADYPASSEDELRANWLSVGADRAVISHESALQLLDLADVMPNRVHLLVPRKDRGKKKPQRVTLHTATRPLDRGDVWTWHGIRTTSPARSIVDAAAHGTAPEQIAAAVEQALDRGLTTRGELRRQASKRSQLVRDLIDQAIGGLDPEPTDAKAVEPLTAS